jgi:hypothetical protein
MKDHSCRYHAGNFNGYTRPFYDRVSLNGREWISSRLRRIAAVMRRSMAARASADMLSPSTAVVRCAGIRGKRLAIVCTARIGDSEVVEEECRRHMIHTAQGT